MLTVPLTSRELQIEGQIDTLDRRVLLGALLLRLLRRRHRLLAGRAHRRSR